MSAAVYLYRRFVLPSGRMAEVRRIEDGQRPEVVLRYVTDDNNLAASEFSLTLHFLLTRAREVARVL